jgi:hypothetical protein
VIGPGAQTGNLLGLPVGYSRHSATSRSRY